MLHAVHVWFTQVLSLADRTIANAGVTSPAHGQGTPDADKGTAVYRDFLSFSADFLAPEDFLEILPENGNMHFYSRYIERSYVMP